MDLTPVFDPDIGAYRTRYDETIGASPEFTVLSAVAAVAGVPVTALDDVLYDHVDPDVLAALFDATGESGRTTPAGVWFAFAEHRVFVRSDGLIAIYPPEAEPPGVPFGSEPEP